MVLDPLIVSNARTCRFSRVLIDGGSSLNLLYQSSLEKLGIRESDLRPTTTTFHGVLPGPACAPLGKIQLDVIFGTEENFRREPIWFEVVNLTSSYHALLGRPALAKFMAIPHYAYLKTKVPGPHGVITVAGCFRRSMECASAGSKLAEALIIAEEKRAIMRNVAMAQQDIPASSKPAGEGAFQPAKETKRILLDPSDPTKFVTIGAGLDSK